MDPIACKPEQASAVSGQPISQKVKAGFSLGRQSKRRKDACKSLGGAATFGDVASGCQRPESARELRLNQSLIQSARQGGGEVGPAGEDGPPLFAVAGSGREERWATWLGSCSPFDPPPRSEYGLLLGVR